MEQVETVVFGKPGCGLCDAAKEKLDLMKIPWRFENLQEQPSNWRETGLVEARAMYALHQEAKLPIIRFNGSYYTYTEAIKCIKEFLKQKKKQEQEQEEQEVPELVSVEGAGS